MIDGQQRNTTTSLLVAAIRDAALREGGDQELEVKKGTLRLKKKGLNLIIVVYLKIIKKPQSQPVVVGVLLVSRHCMNIPIYVDKPKSPLYPISNNPLPLSRNVWWPAVPTGRDETL